MITEAKNKKLTFNFLTERGFVPTCIVGAGNRIYNKWGFELDIHCDFVYCQARVKTGEKYENRYISYESELIDIEKQLKIDKTPNITKMSIDELKSMIPDGYVYVLNKRKKYIKPDSSVSFLNKKGRYRITNGDDLISEGYNDEDESYFLCRSLLHILDKEKMLPKNK